MKRFILICLISIICAGFFVYPSLMPTVDATTADPIISLTLEGKPLLLTAPSYAANTVPLVPMREFFQALGAQVNWFPETQQITAYKNNAFIKFKLSENIAYYNGQSFKLTEAPRLIDGLTYLPLDFVARAFDLNLVYDVATGTAALKSRDVTRFYYLESTFFETRTFDAQHFTIALPFAWNALDRAAQVASDPNAEIITSTTLSPTNTYGIRDEYDDYHLRFDTPQNPNKLDVNGFQNNYKAQLLEKHKKGLILQREYTTQFNRQPFNVMEYKIVSPTSERYFITYITRQKDQIYIFEGSYSPTSETDYMQRIFYSMMTTLQFVDTTILTQNEHYIEHPAFINLGTSLTSKIISNQDVDGTFAFSGRMTHHSKIDGIYAKVYKENPRDHTKISETTFSIPINVNGSFSTQLHTPFGVGKHNYEIYALPKDELLMQFSIVNLSNQVTQYLIPSTHIQSDSIEVKSLASYLTHDKTSDYFRAKSIFDWVVSEIEFEYTYPKISLNLKDNPPRVLREIMTTKRADALEYNLLLAGLLRSAEIESKVVSGQIQDDVNFFVEAYINGKWIVIDPVSHMMAAQYPHLKNPSTSTTKTPINSFAQYHYIMLKDYHALFEALKVLE